MSIVKKVTKFPRGRREKSNKSSDSSEKEVLAKPLKSSANEDLFQTEISSHKKSSDLKNNKSKKKKEKKRNFNNEESNVLNSVDNLSYPDLQEGMLVLGCVSSVGDYEVKVSLPGHLVGKVGITNISGPYTKALKEMVEENATDSVDIQSLEEMFRPGQVVRCCVQKVEVGEKNFHKVSLSLDPKDVQNIPSGSVKKNFILQAAVVSVEDHGFVMDVGIPGQKSFLPLKKAKNFIEKVLSGKTPTVGQLLPTVVVKNDSNLITLSCEQNKFANASITDKNGVNVHTMLPGLSFQAKVLGGLKGGMKVKLESVDLEVFVTKNHIANEMEEDDEVNVQILYVTPTVNTIYGTTKSHLQFGTTSKDLSGSDLNDIKVGSLVKDAEVLESSKSGLIIQLGENVLGSVSARQVTELKEIPNLKEKFPPGTKVKCKVIQYDFVDAMFICSMQKSLLNENALQADQLKVGDKVTCKVKNLNESGAVVVIGKKMEAFIPNLHLSDVPLKNPAKKFIPGMKLTCRVLRLEPERRRLHLTNKSILVKEEYPIVSSYADKENVGKVTEGVVTTVNKSGLILQLFGSVRGFVPKSKMSQEEIEYPEKLFYIGQVLKCLVLDQNEEKRRMSLSLIIGGTSKPLGKREKKEGERLKIGHFYKCQVVEKASDGLNVRVELNENDFVNAFIPKQHLTDHPSLADQLLDAYSEGEMIEETLCFEKDILPILTLKPLIVKAVKSKELPKNFDELQEEVVLPGVVCMIKNYGVFLRLPVWKFRKSALVPMRHLSNSFVDDVNDLLVLNQTMVGKVIERNEEEQKVTMTTNFKKLPYDSDETVLHLSSLMKDRSKMLQNHPMLKGFRPGDCLTCKVLKLSQFGAEVVTDEGVKGIVTNTNLGNLTLSINDTLPVVVLFVDLEFECLELSADPDLMKKCSFAMMKRIEMKTEVTVKASVQLVKTEMLFASLCVKTGPMSGKFLHIPTRHHINDNEGFGEDLQLHDNLNVVIRCVDGQDVIGCLEDKRKQKLNLIRKRAKSESEHNPTVTSASPPMKRAKNNSVSSETSEMGIKDEMVIKPFKRCADPGWNEDFQPWKDEKPANKNDESIDESSGQNKKLKTHISKKEKKELTKLENEEIAKTEQRILDGEVAEPETVEEFERLVFASPNASLCWVKFMAFLANKNDIAKAREVAKRALEKINFREEDERLNVYMAWLNLENAFGSETEAENLLGEALKFNDQFKVYSRVAEMYQASGKPEKAEKYLKIMVKKYCKEKEVWIQLGTFYFKQKNFKEARFTLQRSIQNLDKKDHVDITSKFGQLEFKLGESERGKTIFETILGNYPARSDLWSVYVDMLEKFGDIEASRAVFERMIRLNLQPKKMKFFFKKYLQFEEKQGNEQGVESVRKKALEYVHNSLN